MGEIVLTNANIRGFDTGSVGNWSTYITSVAINYSAELHDKTTFRSSGRKRIGGLKDASVTITWNQDFADNKVDEILFDLVGSSSGWATIKATTAVAGASNPRYYGHLILESYSPLSGNVGDLQQPSVTFQANGLFRRSTTAT